MSIFKIVGERLEDGAAKEFFVDNHTLIVSEVRPELEHFVEDIDLSTPGLKKPPFRLVKIQLGLNCNYDCSYCSQKSQPRADQTTAKDIDDFMVMLDALPKTENVAFEFWGGEPFVYFKTLKPLAERIRAKFPDSKMLVITNGSLLTKPIVDWLYDMKFGMGISHDGPGQHMRSGDPFVDNLDSIKYAIDKLLPEFRLSINSTLNNTNKSRVAIIDYLQEKFPGYFIPSGEMDFIAVYDEEGAGVGVMTTQDHFNLRRDLWAELRFVEKTRQRCHSQSQEIEQIVKANGSKNLPRVSSFTKCGMESAHVLAIDLKGNVLTCQNVSSTGVAPNGQSHKIGHVSNIAGIALKTAKHWTQRQECLTCPVLRLCRGACMFIEGPNRDVTCELAYSNAVTKFAIAFEEVTGFIPVYIDGEWLTEQRKDIWGSLNDWGAAKRVIPIKQI